MQCMTACVSLLCWLEGDVAHRHQSLLPVQVLCLKVAYFWLLGSDGWMGPY